MEEMPEMRIQTPDQKDPLEKEMATHSSILAWKIPYTEEPDQVTALGVPTVPKVLRHFNINSKV